MKCSHEYTDNAHKTTLRERATKLKKKVLLRFRCNINMLFSCYFVHKLNRHKPDYTIKTILLNAFWSPFKIVLLNSYNHQNYWKLWQKKKLISVSRINILFWINCLVKSHLKRNKNKVFYVFLILNHRLINRRYILHHFFSLLLLLYMTCFNSLRFVYAFKCLLWMVYLTIIVLLQRLWKFYWF